MKECSGSNAVAYTTEQERKRLLEDLLLSGSSSPKRANTEAKNPGDRHDAYVYVAPAPAGAYMDQ